MAGSDAVTRVVDVLSVPTTTRGWVEAGCDVLSGVDDVVPVSVRAGGCVEAEPEELSRVDEVGSDVLMVVSSGGSSSDGVSMM